MWPHTLLVPMPEVQAATEASAATEAGLVLADQARLQFISLCVGWHDRAMIDSLRVIRPALHLGPRRDPPK